MFFRKNKKEFTFRNFQGKKKNEENKNEKITVSYTKKKFSRESKKSKRGKQVKKNKYLIIPQGCIAANKIYYPVSRKILIFLPLKLSFHKNLIKYGA